MAGRFKDIEAQLNGQRIPTVPEVGQAYKRQVEEEEAALRELVTNPMGKLREAVTPAPAPVPQERIQFTPEEQAKNAAAWQQFTASRPEAAPNAAELAAQEADMQELRAGAAAREAAPAQAPRNLLDDPEQFRKIRELFKNK